MDRAALHKSGGHGGIVMAGISACNLLSGKCQRRWRLFVGLGVIAGCISSVTMIYPTSGAQGRLITASRPVALASMEGLFETPEGAPVALIGQPDTDRLGLESPVLAPNVIRAHSGILVPALLVLSTAKKLVTLVGLKDVCTALNGTSQVAPASCTLK